MSFFSNISKKILTDIQDRKFGAIVPTLKYPLFPIFDEKQWLENVELNLHNACVKNLIVFT